MPDEDVSARPTRSEHVTRTARAVRYSEFGAASVLRVVDVDVLPPPPERVRIAVTAVGINPSDAKIRSGALPDFAPTLPAGVGREISGIVESLGEGVDSLSLGDEVFGSVAGGALAEFVIAKPSSLTRRPPAVDPLVAATLPLAGQTAHRAVASLDLTHADTVFVSAAAGGVGVVASQLAVRTGATVIGSASEANHEFLRSIGVTPVLYGEGLVDRLQDAAPEGITAALDLHGAASVEAAIAAGVPRDRIATIAADAQALGVRSAGRGLVDVAVLDDLADLVARGDLVVPIEAVFALEDVVAAFERLEEGHLLGKIVVSLLA